MSETISLKIPDLGGARDVDVIEILARPGDRVEKDQPLITLEGDKATMDVPAEQAGTLKSLQVNVGDKVNEGDPLAELEVDEMAGEASDDSPAQPAAAPEAEPAVETAAEPEPAPRPLPAAPAPARPPATPPVAFTPERILPGKVAYASPAVRAFARTLGVDLTQVPGSGRKGRILKEDVEAWVKQTLQKRGSANDALGLIPWPEVDFSRFGEIEEQPLNRIRKLSGANLHRNWVRIPHVTQHEEADITEMEAFRKSLKAEAEQRGTRLTPLVFIIKAVVAALKALPQFNASLSADGETLILKKYFHIGVAVDTPNGLVVPVLRDCYQKGFWQLAEELGEISARARKGKLRPDEMQGGCFSISSLGGIGGTAFSPIINAPEVAILGVSRAHMAPVWDGTAFQPRLMLPLDLSYDHRVIDGADAARFVVELARNLGDLRRLLL